MNPFAKLVRAASYTTACPCLRQAENEQELAGLAKYLPVVGIAIGAILVLEYFLLSLFHIGALLRSCLLTVSWLIITGGIHIDGLMDTADGIFSHRTKERMLEIMKDSRVGNFGVLAGLAIILLKLFSLVELPETTAIGALLLTPVWSRWTTVIAIGAFPYLRQEGMGKIWHDTTRLPGDLLFASVTPILITAVICLIFNNIQIALIALLSVAAGSACIAATQRILGGQTGDTYGAVTEIGESGGLLLTAVFL